ncbi:MAG TPA: carboxypeptidase regulatory-like domain-containing protein [Pyrinomonadaceae bacterium]|nr:carboxypeptidase regulatory-like domain-containing protein [Pyrinomonadaceae bacterium]
MNSKLNQLLTSLFCGVFLSIAAVTISAQTSRGTVSGNVTDPNGAVVAGAEVELKNSATNYVRTVTTNDSGIYRFDAVDLGTYELTIKAKGFKTVKTTGLEVQANRTATVDQQLEIGETETVVDVSASGGELLLQTSEPVKGGNFGTREVVALPSGTLNPYNLARLLPGVATATGSGAEFGNASQFSINGQRPRGNNYLIDGTENNDISVTGPAMQINNEDAVQEVSVQTGLFSAEFGRAGGGVFNIITKSGTNDFHGTAKWLILSQVFDALDNGDRNNGLTEPAVYTENVFGGTIGGPLPLPKFGIGGRSFYRGRDRTFFFFGLQWDRFRSTTSFGAFTVPTELGVQRLRTLFPVGANPRVDLYLNAIGNTRGLTNISNISLDPTSAVVRGSIQVGRVGVSAPQIADTRQWVFRVDHKVNDSHQLAFRYTDDDTINPATAMNSPGFTRDFAGVSRNFLVTHTWVMSSSLTNEFRVSPYGLIDFDFPISVDAPPLAFTMPNISISGLTAIGIATNIPQFRKAENFLLQNTTSKVHGAHTFRFGVEFLKQTAKQRPPFNERGSFTFNAATIRNQQGQVIETWSGLANFVDNFSGQTGNANINFGEPVYDPSLLRQSYFFQDTWKTTPNLTLTLGLRYENFGQPANNAFSFPAFAGFDAAQFLVPNSVKRDNNNFGPIVGFAYTPTFESGPFGWLFGNNKSVIRGGYQVSYDTFFNNMLSNIAADSPNNTSTTTTAPSSGRGSANFFPSAIPSTPRAPTARDTQTSVFNPNIRNPYTQRWSFGLQRDLPANFFMDLSYVGSAGRKLFVTEDLNPINPATPGQRIFPALGIRRYRTSGANSDYHSMQVRLDKRLTRGLQMTASYTWSKLIDQISEIFATDSSNSSLASVPGFLGGLQLDRAVSDYHRQHRFVVSYVWEIPGPRHGFLNHALGGWQIAGITSFQDGAPFTLINGLDRDGDGLSGSDRPDVGNPNAPHNTRAQIVPIATCATGLRNPELGQCVTRNDVYAIQVAANTGFPGAATFGRNTERTNPVENFDMSFFKIFRVRENLKLEYRLEAFNIFNHPQFTAVPGHNLTSTLAGNYFNYNLTNGGGRSMRMGLKITF